MSHTLRDPPPGLELWFGGAGSENNCPSQKICHAQELHGGASWRSLMTKMQIFEKSTKFAQNQLRLHEINTNHTKHTFSPPAALRVRSGGDLVGGLPPGCRSNVALYLLPVRGRQHFYDFWVLRIEIVILLCVKIEPYSQGSSTGSRTLVWWGRIGE